MCPLNNPIIQLLIQNYNPPFVFVSLPSQAVKLSARLYLTRYTRGVLTEEWFSKHWTSPVYFWLQWNRTRRSRLHQCHEFRIYIGLNSFIFKTSDRIWLLSDLLPLYIHGTWWTSYPTFKHEVDGYPTHTVNMKIWFMTLQPTLQSWQLLALPPSLPDPHSLKKHDSWRIYKWSAHTLFKSPKLNSM